MRAPILLAAVIASTAAAQQPFEFRGVPMGASEQEFSAHHPDFDCSTPSGPYVVLGDRQCQISFNSMYGKGIGKPGGPKVNMAALDFGGAFAENMGAFFFDDRMLHALVALKPVDFDRVVGAIGAKFGEPTSKRVERFTTKGGLSTSNDTYIWKVRGGSITAWRYGASLDQSSISYQADGFDAAHAAKERSLGRGGAGKL